MASQFLLFGNYDTKKCLLVGTKNSPYLCTQLRTGREDAHARQSSNEFDSAEREHLYHRQTEQNMYNIKK